MSEAVVLTEVSSSNIDLGESLKWSASWFNLFNSWWFVIEIDHDTSVESVLSILNNHGGLSSLMEWWRYARQVRWGQKLSINCDTSKDTDWISSVVELVTIDMDFSTTIGWSSKRVASVIPGGLKNTNSIPSVTFWLLSVNVNGTSFSGGVKVFGGLWHLASVDETTLAGVFPRAPNIQKVSLALLMSLRKSNG